MHLFIKGKYMNNVTAIILARNEEQHIEECIKSIQCADEILVIDDGSTDQTVSLAEQLGAKVIHHALNGDWAQQRRFGISQSSCEWILFIDSDERVSSELNDEIRQAVQRREKKHIGYLVIIYFIIILQLMVLCDQIRYCA